MTKVRSLPVRRGPTEESGSDGEVDAMLMDGLNDDFDFKNAQSFLSNDLQTMYKDSQSAKKSRKESVADFEKTARKWSEQVENDAGHLMVRDKSGKWRAPVVNKQPAAVEEEPQEQEHDKEPAEEQPKTIKEWAEELSVLAKSITENPEVECGKLKRLGEYYKCKDEKRRMIGMAATVAIFRDILPSYTIRELTEAESAVKVSKEVQAQRSYEQTLLRSYTDFVTFCKSEFGKRGDLVPFKSLSELCKSASCRSFNSFESVLSVVACAAAVNRSEKVRAVGCKALRTLFGDTEDASGRLTMLAVKSIAGSLRDRQYKVLDGGLFVALESVRLRSRDSITVKPDISLRDANPQPTSKVQSHLSKRERKEQKLEKKETRKKAVVEASEAQKQQQKWARETREYLFAILFGFLKSADKQEQSLLASCMSAISRFSAYLGLEYFTDLTNAIKVICERHCKAGGNLELSLHCIAAVLRMSNLQESAATLDLKYFFDLYYRLLRTDHGAMSQHAVLVGDVFGLLFKSNKILPKERVASFAHRLTTSILASRDCKKLLSLQLADLFTLYPAIAPLLDSEPSMIGMFMGSCDDTDICRPFCQPLNQKALLADAECAQILTRIFNKRQ